MTGRSDPLQSPCIREHRVGPQVKKILSTSLLKKSTQMTWRRTHTLHEDVEP